LTDIIRWPTPDGPEVVKRYEAGTNGQATVRKGLNKYRCLHIDTQDQSIINDGSDTETITVSVVDGLAVGEGIDPSNADVLSYDGGVAISVDGSETTKTLTNGSVEFDITTDKAADSEIEIAAKSLADHPAESDSATIEVVSQ